MSISLSSPSLGMSTSAFEFVRGPKVKLLLPVNAGRRELLGFCNPLSRWKPPLASTRGCPKTNLVVRLSKLLSCSFILASYYSMLKLGDALIGLFSFD